MNGFLNSVWSAVKTLARSRKFQVAALSAIVWGVGKLGFDVAPADLMPIVAPLWLYVFGVAMEDAGKAAKIVEADSKLVLADVGKKARK